MKMVRVLPLLGIVMMCIASVVATAPSLVPFNASTSLYGSYYGHGDCFQQPSTTDMMLIAPTINSFDFNMCGMCYKVTGPNGKSVVVRVFDSCSTTDCPAQWTLNAFSNGPYYQIGCPPGTCQIKLQVTECQVQNLYGGKVALWFDDWNNQYAFGVVPVNILVRVETLYINYTANQKIDCASSNRVVGPNSLPNFACPGNPNYIQFPYTLTLCSYSGECLSQTFLQEYKNQMITTNFQFTQGYSTTTTAATTTTTAKPTTTTTTTTTVKPTTTTAASSTTTKSTTTASATTTTGKATTTGTTTTSSGPSPPQKLYATVSTPTVSSDAAAVNLAVKFEATVAGRVTGIQVYRGANVLITQGALWNSTGSILASATFSSPSPAGGWVEVSFASPVTITANKAYTISYLAPAGRYAAINNGFTTTRTVGNLVVAVGGGVYSYSSSPSFPSSSYQNSEYFVSPIFVTP